MKFRKKPVIIEAFQEGKECPLWFTKAAIDETVYYNKASGKLEIITLEGIMQVSKGDWIIRGVNGEIYPCKPDIFEKTYEEIPDNATP